MNHQHHLVGLAEQGGEIFHRTKIGLDLPALALDGGLLDLQIGEGLRLDREPLGKAVAFARNQRFGLGAPTPQRRAVRYCGLAVK
jgi:hypothetical protein